MGTRRRATDPTRPSTTNPTGGFREGFIRHESTSPEYPYYFTRADDPGYGYIPDYGDPRNAPMRYKLEDIFWLVGATPPDEQLQEWRQPQEPKEMSATALEGPIAVIYGEDRIGGSMIDLVPGTWIPPGVGSYVSGLAAAFALGHGEIDSVVKTEYGVEGFKPTVLTGAQGVWQKVFLGTAAQAADPTLTALHLTHGDGPVGQTYPNIAYVLELVQWLSEGPLSDHFIKPVYTVKGKKLLNPALGVDGAGLPNMPAAYSNQGVLALADYLASVRYGLRAGVAGIDWPSVLDSAAYADATVGSSSVTSVKVNNPEEILPSVNSNLYYPDGTGGPPTVTFSAPGGGGVLATAVVVAERWSQNQNIWIIKKILVTNPGSGYVGAPTITVSTSAYGGRALNYTVSMGEKRFSFNMAIMRQMTHRGVIDMIRSHFRGYVLRRRGKFRIVIDRPRASVYLFDPTNASPSTIRRDDLRSPNRVIVEYVDPEQDYKTVEAVQETAGVTAGTEVVVEERVPLQGLRSVSLANRIAWYRLKKGLLNLAGSIVGHKAIQMKIEPYDRVQNSLSGFAAQDFEVRLVGRSIENQYSYEIGQYDESVFSDDLVQSTPPAISTSLPDPLAPPPPPNPNSGFDWSTPVARVFDPSKQTGWTSSGYFTGVVPARFADIATVDVAFVIPAGSPATPNLTLDATTPIEVDEIYVTINGTTAPDFSISIERSALGAVWVNADVGNFIWSRSSIDTVNNRSTWWVRAAGGSYRYWRVVLTSATIATPVNVYEMTLRSRTDDLWPYVSHYRLYDRDGVFVEEVRSVNDISSLEPYTARTYTVNDPINGQSGTGTRIMQVEPVSHHGVVGGRFSRYDIFGFASAGNAASAAAQVYVPQTQENVAIIAGGNPTLVVAESTGLVRLTGHTGAAAIHGLATAHTGGRRIVLENASTTHRVEIYLNSAVEATPAYRFGASGMLGTMVALFPLDVIEFIYDGSSQRWMVQMDQVQVRSNVAGNVGVGLGAVTPTAKLHVDGTGKFTGLLTADVGLAIGGTATAGSRLDSMAADQDSYFRTTSTTGYSRVLVHNSVGAGTGIQLLVYGSAFPGTSPYGPAYANLSVITGGGANSLIVGTTSAQALTLVTSATARVTITAGGQVTILASGAGTVALETQNGVQWNAKNSGGTSVQFLVPIYSDNVTYLNFGSAGFKIRTSGTVVAAEFTASGSLVIGAPNAFATTATTGFPFIPSCAGPPTGTPEAVTGKVPLIYDTTNNRLYAYNGAWKMVALA